MLNHARTAAAIILFIAGAAHAAGDVRMTEAQMTALGVQVQPVTARVAGRDSGGGSIAVAAQVVVPPQQVHVVSAPLGGLVERQSVAVNSPVRKGQELARLQSPAFGEAQREYLHARSAAQLAKNSLDRDELLLRDGIISEARHAATRVQNAQAQAMLAERLQALRLSGVGPGAIARIERDGAPGSAIDVVSPIDGVVMEQVASLGQRVEANAPLFRVARLDPLWLEIRLPMGAAATPLTGAMVTVPAAGARGRVLSTARAVDPASQTVLVRAEIREGAGRLFSGSLVEAVIELPGASGRWTVPTAAVVRSAGRAMVFVRTPTGFSPHEVTVISEGAADSVVSGAFDGKERIAVKGVSAIKAALAGIGGE